jgi:nitroreductase
MDTPHGRAARSGDYLARHFAAVPLLLIGFSLSSAGSSIHPALWSAMLAVRAEGIGCTMTDILRVHCADEMFDLPGVPKDAGWHMHGVIPMGYPTDKWGVAARRPVHEVAARNSWQGDPGFTVPEPLWPE